MILKFSYATFLALASISTSGDAFVVPSVIRSGTTTAVTMVGGWDNDDFLEALSGGNSKPEEEEQEPEDDGDQGGSRFKAILEQAKQAQPEPAPHVIMNPFLDPPKNPAPSANPDELSVEEQARMYREMMQNGGGRPSAGADLPPPPPRQARTDRAGRPLGRNRDADSISNTADLYFAQLKRDSSVRGMARLRGDDEEAQQVFGDEGIKELESLIVENPYLKG